MTLRAVAGRDGQTYSNPTLTGLRQGVPAVLAGSGIPFIHVSSGSIGNNGALTGVTALPTTYSGGAWVYYPANSIAASTPAGWYWTVFSSTTAGTIFNSTYTSGAVQAGTQTAFVTTGPGAFTGDTTERTGPTITIPAGYLGPNGSAEIWTQWACTNSAGNKVFAIRYQAGGTALFGPTVTTVASFADKRIMRNQGVQNKQVTFGLSANDNGQTTATSIYTSIDNSAATTLGLSLSKNTATDNAILEGFDLFTIYRP